MNITSRLDDGSRDVITRAKELAVNGEHEAVFPEHIMLAILRDERLPVVQQLYELDADVDHMRKSLETFLDREGSAEPPPSDQLDFNERSRELLKSAATEADRNPPDQIAPYHLLVGMLYEMGGLPGTVLAEQDLTFRDLRQRYREVREVVQGEEDAELSLVVSESGEPGTAEREESRSGPDSGKGEEELSARSELEEVPDSPEGLSRRSLEEAVTALEGLLERARVDLELAQRQFEQIKEMLEELDR